MMEDYTSVTKDLYFREIEHIPQKLMGVSLCWSLSLPDPLTPPAKECCPEGEVMPSAVPSCVFKVNYICTVYTLH